MSHSRGVLLKKILFARGNKFTRPLSSIKETCLKCGNHQLLSTFESRTCKEKSWNDYHRSSDSNSDNYFIALSSISCAAATFYMLTSNRLEAEKVRNDEDSSPLYHTPYLLIGGGTASISAMRAIRGKDPTSTVTIVGDEDVYPYLRSPLSKELWYMNSHCISVDSGQEFDLSETVLKENDPFDIQYEQWSGRKRSLFLEKVPFYTKPEDLDKDRGGVVMLKGKKITNIDVENKTAHFEDGQSIGFDKCLIATGSSVKTEGEWQSSRLSHRLWKLKSIKDFYAINRRINQLIKCKRSKYVETTIAVYGDGYLSAEVVSALLAKRSIHKLEKLRIVYLLPNDSFLPKVVPKPMSRDMLTMVYGDKNIEVVHSFDLKCAVNKSDSLELTSKNGEKVKVDHIIYAPSHNTPNTQINVINSQDLNIHQHFNGYVANSQLEIAPHIWAAGDVLSCFGSQCNSNESHDRAVRSGRIAGLNMMSVNEEKKSKFEDNGMFWSDLSDFVSVEGVGDIDARCMKTKSYLVDAQNKDMTKQNESHHDSVHDMATGVIFYIDNITDIITGVTVINLFNKLSLASHVVDSKKYKSNDTDQLIKLFNMYRIKPPALVEGDKMDESDVESNNGGMN